MVLKRYFWILKININSKKERDKVRKFLFSIIILFFVMKRVNKIVMFVILKVMVLNLRLWYICI